MVREIYRLMREFGYSRAESLVALGSPIVAGCAPLAVIAPHLDFVNRPWNSAFGIALSIPLGAVSAAVGGMLGIGAVCAYRMVKQDIQEARERKRDAYRESLPGLEAEVENKENLNEK